MIRFEHLAKAFRGRTALHDLTLEIPQGEIFGLLGHNGAGKSTTFGMLLGQIHPDRGEAFIRGVSVQRDRSLALQRVGAIFETPGFYDYLSGWHNLLIFTGYTSRLDKAGIEETVRFVGLEKRIHDPVRVYSHGMRQRLALAQALLPRPEVVLLDEPAEGLDPEGIHEMRHLILRLNREFGMTVLLSSHQLAEVEQLCSKVAILNQGHLVFNGHWNDLARANARFRLEINDWEKGKTLLENHGASVLDRHIVELPPEREIADLVTSLVRAGLRVSAVEPVRQTLEELYLGKVSGK
jgi:ABC-2 type transport system ATP-binding protein